MRGQYHRTGSVRTYTRGRLESASAPQHTSRGACRCTQPAAWTCACASDCVSTGQWGPWANVTACAFSCSKLPPCAARRNKKGTAASMGVTLLAVSRAKQPQAACSHGVWHGVVHCADGIHRGVTAPSQRLANDLRAELRGWLQGPLLHGLRMTLALPPHKQVQDLHTHTHTHTTDLALAAQ